MAISLSQRDYWDLFTEDEVDLHPCAAHEPFDHTWRYPSRLGQGYRREIILREGIELAIASYHLHDDLVLRFPNRPHSLEYCFYLSGYQCCNGVDESGGQYALCGSGIAPEEVTHLSARQPFLAVNVHLNQEIFHACLGNKVPPSLAPLLGNHQTTYHVSYGAITPNIKGVLQQILTCPYWGMTKRLFLESKVLELTAFLVEQSMPALDQVNATLSAETIDCVYHARQILLERLSQPPTLLELARQVGLNDCSLKRGFRQVFGTTVFGYLQQQRMVQAQQLLSQGRMNVQEVARAVGYSSRSNFAAAFRRQFGLNPSAYLAQRKSSR